jgi:hypothetical protein
MILRDAVVDRLSDFLFVAARFSAARVLVFRWLLPSHSLSHAHYEYDRMVTLKWCTRNHEQRQQHRQRRLFQHSLRQ